jgi:hypothetical protein
LIRIGISPARIVSVTLLVAVSMMLILPSPLCPPKFHFARTLASHADAFAQQGLSAMPSER